MADPVKLNLKIYQGSTFNKVLRWETRDKVYKPITAVFTQAPLIVTAVGHGVPQGWRVKFSNIGGTTELNKDEYVIVTETTLDTVTIGDINAVGYKAYTTGGIMEYNAPKSLSGMTARMQIRPKVSSTEVLLELTTENGMIALNDANKNIIINIPAATTEALSFKSAVYSMEMVEGSTVTPFITGSITLDSEITR
jgi:hypothetical protein